MNPQPSRTPPPNGCNVWTAGNVIVLGALVLVAFTPLFDRLSTVERYLYDAAVAIAVISLALLLTPVATRLAQWPIHERDTPRLRRISGVGRAGLSSTALIAVLLAIEELLGAPWAFLLLFVVVLVVVMELGPRARGARR